MTGSYPAHLPQVFPWNVDLPIADARIVVEFLMVQLHPSSFAVTAEPGAGRVRVYFSQVTLNRLERRFPQFTVTSTPNGE